MIAAQPSNHERTRDVVDDRVHEEPSLRQRPGPLRVHESSAHTPAQELLVKQDAVGSRLPNGDCR